MDAGKIVVGIDGSLAGQNALEWAAREAERRTATLLIVHAPDLVAGTALTSETIQTVLEESRRAAAELLRAAADQVSSEYPSVPVATMLRGADPADLLIELGQQAAMVVVGTRGDSRFVGAILGSVSQRVAAHANCPVVVLGRDPRPDTAERVVVLGVSDSPSGRKALRFAFREAADRGATLQAVRAGSESVPSSRAGHFDRLAGAREQAAKLLHDALQVTRAEFPDVRVEARVMDEEPAIALHAAAENAELLVIGCHYPDDRWPSRLGPVASTLLHRSPCPIAVVGAA